MPSPFPGMDPYIEQPGIWQDFHNNLASEIQARLNPKIRPRYYASLEAYVVYESIEIGTSGAGRPDVGVVSMRETTAAYEPALVSPAATATPVESRIALDEPLKLHTVEVHTVGDRRLVTSIEILSPANKTRGQEVFESYRRKRRAILNSEVHLIEIDLLRAGERPPLLDPVPPAPYYLTLSRAEQRPKVIVWPVHMHEAIPSVPVPLLAPDPDVEIDLNAAVAAVYERGAYEIRIDYRQPPPPPVLSPEDQAWVAALTKTKPSHA